MRVKFTEDWRYRSLTPRFSIQYAKDGTYTVKAEIGEAAIAAGVAEDASPKKDGNGEDDGRG